MSRKKTVLVLNAGLEPLHRITPEHAIRMLDKGKASVFEEDPTKSFSSTSGIVVMWPKTMLLKKYVDMAWYYKTPLAWSKTGVMRRDNYLCAYCGLPATTIDHVFPASRGGQNSWENCVGACFKCNNKKSDKTLDEIGWKLSFVPHKPRRDQLVAGTYR